MGRARLARRMDVPTVDSSGIPSTPAPLSGVEGLEYPCLWGPLMVRVGAIGRMGCSRW